MKLLAEFIIPDLPKMTNAIGRKHWINKHKESVKWRRLVAHECNQVKISGLGLEQATLTLTRYSSRPPDADGLVSGFKVVLDAMVRCGVLVDDNYKIIGMPTYRWEYRPTKKGGMVSIKIEGVEK